MRLHLRHRDELVRGVAGVERRCRVCGRVAPLPLRAAHRGNRPLVAPLPLPPDLRRRA